ncbi:hypothetical protein TabM4_14320 [Tabrizicola sp. M-4]
MVLQGAARDLHQNLTRAFLPCHAGGQVRVQDGGRGGGGEVAFAAIGDFGPAFERDLQQVEGAEFPRSDQGARTVFDVVEREALAGEVVVAGVEEAARAQRFQTVGAEDGGDAVPRLVEVAGAEKRVVLQHRHGHRAVSASEWAIGATA